MESAIASDSAVVSTRTTFDGVTVFLHADGSISDRRSFIGRVKLPVAAMWRAWDDISTYTHAEIAGFVKSVRAGTWTPVRIRPAMSEARHQSILSAQVRTRGFGADGWLRRWS